MGSLSTSKTAKLRVLCLHGIGTNSDIYEAQTASIRYQLGDGFTYDFVEGAYPWPAAPGIDGAFGERQMCYSYFDGSAKSALAALRDLEDYLVVNGPFDCVMGFSLGAALVATLLLRPGEHPSQGQIRSAVFYCGILPCDWSDLERHELRPLAAGDAREVIDIPSVHVWSHEDIEYPGQSEQLLAMCKAESRVQVLHHAGHGIPSQGFEVKAIADAVHNMVAKI